MKKYILIFLCLTLAFSMSFCRTSSTSGDSSTSDNPLSSSESTFETSEETENNDAIKPAYSTEDCGMPSMNFLNCDSEYFNRYFKYEESIYRPSYNVGVCRNLTGKQTVVLFFLDDDESHWDADSIELYTNKHIVPALDFLLSEASKWEINLSFAVKRYSTALSSDITLKYEGVINSNLYNGGSSKDVPDQIANDLGYRCNMELLQALETEHSSENIIPLVFVNKCGISYARNQISGYLVDYLEHAVIFSSYISTSPGSWKSNDRYASTIAHEFLHLFGAEDLYYPDNRLILGEKYCINDIMLLDHRDISKLVVDDSTAYQIGWNNELPPIFKDSDWK